MTTGDLSILFTSLGVALQTAVPLIIQLMLDISLDWLPREEIDFLSILDYFMLFRGIFIFNAELWIIGFLMMINLLD